MRDILFVGMPKAQSEQKLTRSSLALGTADTFLYLATLLNPDRLAGINQGGLPVGSWLQKVFDTAARAGPGRRSPFTRGPAAHVRGASFTDFAHAVSTAESPRS